MATRISAHGISPRVVRKCWWLRWADGMALGQVMFFRSGSPSSALIAHEFYHCMSYKRHGFWTFLWRYVTDKKFREDEERNAYEFGANNTWKDPWLRAAKLFGWSPS